MTDKLNEMWAALEAHQPAPSYAEAWATMLKEQTEDAAVYAAADAADAGAWGVAQAAMEAAEAAARAAAGAVAGAVEDAAQRAIDAIRRVTP